MTESLLKLPKGKQSYENIVKNNFYYVDKTRALKTVFEDESSQVLLITRPRRFGKSLTLSMFNSFLSLNYEDEKDLSHHIELFKDKEIYKDKGFCEQFMGQYPVIAISLKDVQGLDFEDAYKALAKEIFKLASKYRFLQNSTNLDEGDKLLLNNLLDFSFLRDLKNLDILKSSLQDLISLLYKHYDKQVILLIDEYDVPLAKSSLNGYYKQMVDLMSAFYSKALKDTDEFVQKAVITGCLRVAKESIFTGVNNFSVNTVFNREDDLTTIIGFTEKETESMLSYFDLSDFKALVKENYDGYNFFNHEIYCSWDVVSFCQSALKQQDQSKVKADCYWINTSSNDIIKQFLGFISPKDSDDMQTLVDGGSVKKNIHVNMNHEDLKNHDSDDFWSMLAYTGYLTAAPNAEFDIDHEPIELVIPNKSILECFRLNILQFFTKDESQLSKAHNILNAVFDGKALDLSNALEDALAHYISIRDFSSNEPKESYYQGFLNGYFSSQNDLLKGYASNAELGNGYADITVKNKNKNIAVIIEIKHAKEESENQARAFEALDQIEKNKYVINYLGDDYVTDILFYGICFCKKSCYVAFKELKK